MVTNRKAKYVIRLPCARTRALCLPAAPHPACGLVRRLFDSPVYQVVSHSRDERVAAPEASGGAASGGAASGGSVLRVTQERRIVEPEPGRPRVEKTITLRPLASGAAPSPEARVYTEPVRLLTPADLRPLYAACGPARSSRSTATTTARATARAAPDRPRPQDEVADRLWRRGTRQRPAIFSVLFLAHFPTPWTPLSRTPASTPNASSKNSRRGSASPPSRPIRSTPRRRGRPPSGSPTTSASSASRASR